MVEELEQRKHRPLERQQLQIILSAMSLSSKDYEPRVVDEVGETLPAVEQRMKQSTFQTYVRKEFGVGRARVGTAAVVRHVAAEIYTANPPVLASPLKLFPTNAKRKDSFEKMVPDALLRAKTAWINGTHPSPDKTAGVVRHDHTDRHKVDDNGKLRCPEGNKCEHGTIHFQTKSDKEMYADYAAAEKEAGRTPMSQRQFRKCKPFFIRKAPKRTCLCRTCHTFELWMVDMSKSSADLHALCGTEQARCKCHDCMEGKCKEFAKCWGQYREVMKMLLCEKNPHTHSHEMRCLKRACGICWWRDEAGQWNLERMPMMACPLECGGEDKNGEELAITVRRFKKVGRHTHAPVEEEEEEGEEEKEEEEGVDDMDVDEGEGGGEGEGGDGGGGATAASGGGGGGGGVAAVAATAGAGAGAEEKKKRKVQLALAVVHENLSKAEFVAEFFKYLEEKYLPHRFIVGNQARVLQEVIKHMPRNTLVIRADYGMNAENKPVDAIQDFHWSPLTTTLFSLVVYRRLPRPPRVAAVEGEEEDDDVAVEERYTFVSPDGNHSNQFVQHCVLLLLQMYQLLCHKDVPLEHVIIVSDNCCSQLKQAEQFGFLTLLDYLTRWGREENAPRGMTGSHMYSGEGHGKASCDAEFAVIKTFLAALARDGKEACNAKAVWTELVKHKMRLPAPVRKIFDEQGWEQGGMEEEGAFYSTWEWMLKKVRETRASGLGRRLQKAFNEPVEATEAEAVRTRVFIYVEAGEVNHNVKKFKTIKNSSTYYGFHALGQQTINKLGGGASHNIIVTKRSCYCEMCRKLDFHLCTSREAVIEALYNHAYEMGWLIRTPPDMRVAPGCGPKMAKIDEIIQEDKVEVRTSARV